MNKIFIWIVILIVSVIGAWGEAQGYYFSSKVWSHGKFVTSEAIKAALGYILGTIMLWISIRFLQQMKIMTPEIQTVIWFTLTMIGVAFLSGKFFRWHLADQLIAFLVFLGIGWLLFHTGG